MAKAILLLSGGLDSTLAGKLLLELGFEVEAVNFVSQFCRCTPKSFSCSAAQTAAKQLDIPLKVFAKGEDYFELVKKPRFGRGRGVNPCIDCRIYTFRRAGEYMREIGADFIATGEVLGQRPMSQRKHTMMLIEKESGLEGFIVRPLCAHLLPPSIPEQKGVIDRDKLKSIQGRNRRPQFRLAEELGLKDYLCPSGGCQLTDVEFAARFKDMLEYEPDADLNSARLLSYGRHFRLPGGAKIVVGRNEPENLEIERLVNDDDVLLEPIDIPGPSVLCRGAKSPESLKTAAALLVSYTKSNTADVEVTKGPNSIQNTVIKNVAPPDKTRIEEWRVIAGRTKSKNK
ncbi:MAG: DUF814 domain-containing protein [Planctomycetota bacterium]|nr:MAG: DUF814 domain-containing protein [Planctomycetota bacterium]